MTSLRFVGDLPLWGGLLIAFAICGVAVLYYRREMVQLSPWLKLTLPTLRALAFMMAILMMTGPVLHHRKIEGELGQVKIYVDGSASMGLRDPSIPTDRKIAIARKLKWWVGESTDNLPRKRADAWGKIAADFGTEPDDVTWDSRAMELSSKLKDLASELTSGLRTQIEVELLPLLENPPPAGSEETDLWNQRVVEHLDRLHQSLEEEVESQYERRLNAGDDSLRDVLVRFDEATRLERVETALMNSEQGLLDQLREFHEVSVFGLVGSDSVALDSGESVGATQPRWSAALPYLSEITDLATGLSNIQTSGGESTGREDRTDSLERQSVAILISDGQHNAKSSPIDVARQLANQGTTIYSVGTGGLKQARDVAILSLDYPGRVFRNDRVRGELLMLDHGQSGLPLLIQIKSEDEVLWQESLQTQGSGQRRIEFDFPIAGEVDRLEGLDLNRVEQHVLPVELQALIAPLPDELETANNSKTLSIGVVTQTFKVLLMDGRSRWETRYLRNVFERDERWEVTFVLAGPGTHHPSLPRGEEADQFPLTRSQLFDYDLIILGEVERQLFEEHELQWVEEFVSKRGGGLIWLDGQRQKLRKYQGSNLGPLLPVSWIDDSPIEAITQFDLTTVGSATAALRFQGRDLENQNFWNQLPAPKTVQSIEVKPGASVWVDVVAGDARYPGVVSQQVGAGRILFFAFDETWRWRFKSADLWHQRFWNQIAMTTMPAPFTASDDFMAVDTGAFSYSKGEPIAIRVRLSDENGKPNPSAFVEALVWNQDELVSTVHLESDSEVPGIYRSQAGAFPPGEYRVTVRASGYTQDALKASSEFVVEGDMSAESAETRVNMALLGQMARESGGRVLLEEEMNQLPELLQQFSSGKVVETETPLWQSYFWFSTVLLLLSAEWFLRKRSGLL